MEYEFIIPTEIWLFGASLYYKTVIVPWQVDTQMHDFLCGKLRDFNNFVNLRSSWVCIVAFSTLANSMGFFWRGEKFPVHYIKSNLLCSLYIKDQPPFLQERKYADCSICLRCGIRVQMSLSRFTGLAFSFWGFEVSLIALAPEESGFIIDSQGSPITEYKHFQILVVRILELHL